MWRHQPGCHRHREDAIAGSERLAGFAVSHQLDPPRRPESSHVTDASVAVPQLFEPTLEFHSQLGCRLHQALLFEDFQVREGCGGSHPRGPRRSCRGRASERQSPLRLAPRAPLPKTQARYPEVSPLPSVITSGTTSKCSSANHDPAPPEGRHNLVGDVPQVEPLGDTRAPAASTAAGETASTADGGNGLADDRRHPGADPGFRSPARRGRAPRQLAFWIGEPQWTPIAVRVGSRTPLPGSRPGSPNP